MVPGGREGGGGSFVVICQWGMEVILNNKLFTYSTIGEGRGCMLAVRCAELYIKPDPAHQVVSQGRSCMIV